MVEQLAPNEKRCSKCKEVKDRGEFYKTGKIKNDGLSYSCKKCLALKRNPNYKPKPMVNKDLPIGKKLCTKCLEIKDKDDFYLNKKLSGNWHPVSQCKKCVLIKFLEKKDIAREKTDSCLLTCPICNRSFSRLVIHALQTHGINKEGLEKLGCTKFISDKASENITKSLTGKKYPSLQKGFVAEIKTGRIYFPKQCLPLDCEYINVLVDKSKLQIQFNPINRQLKSSKKIGDLKRHTYRGCLRVHKDLLDNLDIIRPLILPRNRAGFVIQFYDEDETILQTFEVWAKSGQSMRNQNQFCIHGKTASIASHLWPINAEYVFFERNYTNRNKFGFLDIIPVSRNGFIVGKIKLDFKQYIGTENCSKVWKAGNRFLFSFMRFVKTENLLPSDWDLVKTLPNGALRFRMYKEREQLERAG